MITPREIWIRAARLSYNGYNTTVIAEQKHQMIPMTTHAVSPRTPKMVLAKKSGSGIKMSMITVWWVLNRLESISGPREKIAYQDD